MTGDPRRRPAGAFTLAELVLGMAITAMVALAVAGLTVSLSNAYAHSRDLSETLQSARTSLTRIERTIRQASLAPAAGDGKMVLWTGDDDGNGQINLSELVLLVYDQPSGEIVQTQLVFSDPPTPQEQLADENLSLVDATNAAYVEKLFSRSVCDGSRVVTVLAGGVDTFSIIPDDTPPSCRLVLMRLTVGEGTRRLTVPASARLRADLTDNVVWVGSTPILQLDTE